ncbi:tRNA:m(4)X modification enzyme TRM13 [Trichinella pseudospiralis]
MLYSTATRKPPPHQRRRPLTLEEYGYIDGFLMSIQFEKKRLAQTLRSQVVTTPSCQGTRMHCSTSPP